MVTIDYPIDYPIATSIATSIATAITIYHLLPLFISGSLRSNRTFY